MDLAEFSREIKKLTAATDEPQEMTISGLLLIKEL
jgi:spore maturation protein CgeB